MFFHEVPVIEKTKTDQTITETMAMDPDGFCGSWMWGVQLSKKFRSTVDGRNPAPVDRSFIQLFTGFFASQVVQDFFHQQFFQSVSQNFGEVIKSISFQESIRLL